MKTNLEMTSIASTKIHNAQKQIGAYANKHGLPMIPIKAKDVTLISEPNLFYDHLISGVKAVNSRLLLSALYLGSGFKELNLIKAIRHALHRNSNLDVTFAFDAHRATRLDTNGSSVSLLQELTSMKNVKLNLIDLAKDGSIVTSLLSRFQKWNEIPSTYHSKMMIFDSEIVITGANLSGNYFENRQDRYMSIENSKPLCDYMLGLIEHLGKTYTKTISQIIKDHNQRFISHHLDTFEDHDSYVIPLMQYGPSKISDKEDFLRFLDSILPENAHVFLSTGYFNPNSTINSIRIDSVLAPSEGANGFFNGGGLLRYIPRLYTAIYKRYIGTHDSCNFNLYDRPGWSFHAKGLWVEGLDEFYIHMIGSSNFNCRSSMRDFETQLVILTRDKKLISKLQNERLRLWNDSRPMNESDSVGLNWVFSAFSRILRTYL